MYTFNESVVPLLPLLKCPLCFSNEGFEIINESLKISIHIPILDKHLRCRHCNTQYPITEDFIPIMWDSDVKNILTEIHDSHNDSLSTICANMEIYEAISDDYHLYSRNDSRLAITMQNATRKIFHTFNISESSSVTIEEPIRYQLDFGCGPGQVMSWLKEFGFKQIGLDVSLNNLRNARKYTGCLVVCGNACNMPFANETIDLITESAVLHHIYDWKSAIKESLRICKKSGGIIFDSEPSNASMDWSKFAIGVFNTRFHIYHLLSYIMHNYYIFRNVNQAKFNYMRAEIHNQPRKGFPLDEIKELILKAGFFVDIVQSPTLDLTSKPNPNWQSFVLNVLSARNPWNPEYGSFIAIAKGK